MALYDALNRYRKVRQLDRLRLNLRRQRKVDGRDKRWGLVEQRGPRPLPLQLLSERKAMQSPQASVPGRGELDRRRRRRY